MEIQNKSREQLLEMRKEIDLRLAQIEKEERKAALEALQEAARARGFTLEELTGAKGKSARPKAPAKYRDPASGKEWSGRGRRPAWLAGVQDLSKYEI